MKSSHWRFEVCEEGERLRCCWGTELPQSTADSPSHPLAGAARGRVCPGKQAFFASLAGTDADSQITNKSLKSTHGHAARVFVVAAIVCHFNLRGVPSEGSSVPKWAWFGWVAQVSRGLGSVPWLFGPCRCLFALSLIYNANIFPFPPVT